MSHRFFNWLFYLDPKYTRIWGVIFKNLGILLEAIFGDSYSITFGDGLVTVKPQPVTSNLNLLMSHNQ